MRMRSSKWFVVAALVAGGVLAYRSSGEIPAWIKRHRFRIEGLEQALRSEMYLLETNRWLQFDIPGDTPLARLVSNASIPATQRPKPGSLWAYAIEYQLVGSDGELVKTGVYHFKGEYVVFREQKSGRTVQVNYFLEPQLTPLTGGHWMLNFADPELKGVRLLRLRLHWHDPEIKEVGVRLYFRKTVPRRKVGYLWNRLSTAQKQNLARGNVYSFDGLNAWEKLCLLRYHWPASSPPGIPGRDFKRRAVFIRDDSETLQVVEEWVPAGIAVDERHYGLLPLTNVAGLYLLELLKYPPDSDLHVIANSFSWCGWQRQENQTFQITWSGPNQIVALTNQNGLLRVGSSAPLYLRLLLVDDGQTNEVTPEPVHLLAFTCSPTNSVEYLVEHVNGSPTLFRVDLRRHCRVGDELTPETVRYELLGHEGETLQTGEVTLTNKATPYDWLHTREGLTDVTEPQSLCFVLPPTTRVVRITSSKGDVFVNAYSRPSQLVRKLRVPEDYFPSTVAPTQPSWFTLRPPDHVKRREAGKTCLVRVQPRMPEFDPLVLAGLYEWDSFLPRDYAQGHMVLVPIKENRVPRPEALPTRYLPVSVGVVQQVCFEAAQGKTNVEPTLILVCTHDSRERVSVSLNERMIFDGYLQGNITEIRLGTLNPGVHQLYVRTDAVLGAYMNYLGNEASGAYLRRFCVMVTSNVLHYTYVKQRTDTELLVLRIFSPLCTNRVPYQVRVRFNAPSPRSVGPFADVTILEREATVTPGGTGWVSLIPVQPMQLDDGQAIFLPIGPDFPPGQYEIEVQVNTTAPRWVALSRTTPGLAEKLAITLEPRL